MPQQFRVVQEPPIPTVYSNATRMMFSIYDFRLLFSEQMVEGDGQFVQVDRVGVVMSPQHIKKLMRSVNAKLVEYEARFGPIPEQDDDAQNEEESSPAATDED